jgi:hypothetical protein
MLNDICIVDGCDRLRDKKQNRRICQMHRVRYGRHKSYDLPKKEALPEGIVKICMLHGELNESQVYVSANHIWPQCLKCKKNANNKFQKRNPNRNTNILKKHYYVRNSNAKISKDDYEKMLEEQNNVCKLCKNPETVSNSPKSSGPNRLAIDHCHKTDKIRGLLCRSCNLMLGNAKDSIELLQEAIDYLQKHQNI